MLKIISSSNSSAASNPIFKRDNANQQINSKMEQYYQLITSIFQKKISLKLLTLFEWCNKTNERKLDIEIKKLSEIYTILKKINILFTEYEDMKQNLEKEEKEKEKDDINNNNNNLSESKNNNPQIRGFRQSSNRHPMSLEDLEEKYNKLQEDQEFENEKKLRKWKIQTRDSQARSISELADQYEKFGSNDSLNLSDEENDETEVEFLRKESGSVYRSNVAIGSKLKSEK